MTQSPITTTKLVSAKIRRLETAVASKNSIIDDLEREVKSLKLSLDKKDKRLAERKKLDDDFSSALVRIMGIGRELEQKRPQWADSDDDEISFRLKCRNDTVNGWMRRTGVGS